MLWGGGGLQLQQYGSTGANRTQVIPPLSMPKVACFDQYFIVYVLKVQFSALHVPKCPWKIKFKKIIKTFWRKLWPGSPDPPPPRNLGRGEGGVSSFWGLPLRCSQTFGTLCDKPHWCGTESERRVVGRDCYGARASRASGRLHPARPPT